MPNFDGTDAAETINGTDGDDSIRGRGGNDILNGLGGNDIFVYATGHDGVGDGADSVNGGAGTDTFHVVGEFPVYQAGRSANLEYPYYTMTGQGGVVQFTLNRFNDLTRATAQTTSALQDVERFEFVGTNDPPPPPVFFGFGGALVSSTNDVLTISSLAGTPLSRILFDGGHGDDRLDAGAVSIVVEAIGGVGNDILISGSADDLLIGGDGNDSLTSGSGSDSLAGGAGNDIYVDISASDTLTEAAGGGYDTITTSLASFTLSDHFEKLVHIAGADFTGIGNSADNWIQGGTGTDYLIGLDGNDILYGSGGATNALQGGLGDDLYLVENGGDTLTEFAGEGRDRVETTLRQYTLRENLEDLYYMGNFFFTGIGNELDNYIRGRSGSDRLIGLAGNNTLDGWFGDNDVADYSAAPDAVFASLAAGTASRNGYGGHDTLLQIDNLIGTAFNDVLIGNAGANRLEGGAGTDVLVGNDGNDVIVGGSGAANEVHGGAGDDVYIVTAADTIIEGENGGTDVVEVNLLSFTLANNVENAVFTSNLDVTAIGNAQNNFIQTRGGNDVLVGMEGDDRLYSGAGNDRLEGGAGNDILYGGGGSDRLEGGTGNDLYLVEAPNEIVEAADAGIDRIETTLLSYTLNPNVEDLYYKGIGDFTGIGNALSNVIFGGEGNDRIEGGDGNDTLHSQSGNDVLSGGSGDDILEGNYGSDELFGGAGADRFVAAWLQFSINDIVHDFNRGEGDKIDISNWLLGKIPIGGDAFLDGYVRLETIDFGGRPASVVFLDPDGYGDDWESIAVAVVLGDIPLTQSDFIL